MTWFGGITMRNIQVICFETAFSGICPSQIFGWSIASLAFLHYFWKLTIQSRSRLGLFNNLAIWSTWFWRHTALLSIILGVHDFCFWAKSLLDRLRILGKCQRTHNLRRAFNTIECIRYLLGWMCFSFLSSIGGFLNCFFIWSILNIIVWRLLIDHGRLRYWLPQCALISGHLFRVQFSRRHGSATISIWRWFLNSTSFGIASRWLDISHFDLNMMAI